MDAGNPLVSINVLIKLIIILMNHRIEQVGRDLKRQNHTQNHRMLWVRKKLKVF